MNYPNPEIEKDFPDKILRAAQFAPFAALNGYEEAVAETARLTDKKIELDEYQKDELNTYFESNGQKPCIKPGNYEQTKTRKYKNDIGRAENMQYD